MNKFRVFMAIAMVLTILSTLMMVPAFADTPETGEIVAEETGEIVANEGADAAEGDHDHDHDHDHAATTDDGWVTLGVSDFIALAVAAVILVAFVVAIILFVPKKTKQR